MRRWILATLTVLAFTCQAQPQRPLFVPATGSPIPVGNRPTDVAISDVNGDAKPDLVVANSGSGNVTLLLGDGRGGFTPALGSPFPAGPAPHLVALGDINGDGRLDLTVTSHDSNDVAVLWGDGRGAFGPASGSPFPALSGTRPHNHGLALGDINADGHLDILTSNCSASSVSLLLGNDKGAFPPAPGSPFPVGRCPYPLALGDVNRDGTLDLVTPNLEGSSLTVLLGDKRGTFAPAPNSPVATLPRPYFVALADLNGDSNLDLVATHDDISDLTVLLGDGSGRFTSAPGSPFNAGRRCWKVAVADLNRDGKKDLVMLAGDAATVFLGDGRGGFSPAAGSPFAVARGSWAVAVADLNGDGKLDIVTASFESHTVTVLLGQQP